MKKIGIVTGGTGGHIYPAISFTDYLRELGTYEIFYIGNNDRMESDIVPKHGYTFYSIDNKGLQGSKLDKIKAVFSQFSAIRQARKILKKQKPDIIFGFGGYVTLPVVLAAKSLKIKIVLHEQNAFVGKANRWSAKYADAIFTSYEESFKGEDNVYLYGNPRASLSLNQTKDSSEINRIGLDPNKKIVLVVMGSQGSVSMNKVFKEMIPQLNDIDYQIVFVSGQREYEEFRNNFTNLPNNVFIEEFVDQGKLLPYLDLIISRAGASSITEIAAFGIPSILIPSPFVANNHQYFNAKALADRNATILIEEKEADKDNLIKNINLILNDESLKNDLKNNLEYFNMPNVNQDILKIIEGIIQ